MRSLIPSSFLFFSFQSSSSFSSEGSSSPVPRAEVVLNRSNEPLVQQSLQHVQTYPANTNETLPSDNVEHYHHPPPPSNNEM